MISAWLLHLPCWAVRGRGRFKIEAVDRSAVAAVELSAGCEIITALVDDSEVERFHEEARRRWRSDPGGKDEGHPTSRR